jgi:hypothetical protein
MADITTESEPALTDEDIEKSMEVGDQIFSDLMDSAENIAQNEDTDPVAVVYSVWANLSRYLGSVG